MKSLSYQRYLQVFQKFKSLDSSTLDCYQKRTLFGLIGILIIWTLFVITRPVDVVQHKEIMQLAGQSNYPLTREMAYQLLQEKTINRYQYFRVLRAVHSEQHRIRVQEDIVKQMPKPVDRMMDES